MNRFPLSCLALCLASSLMAASTAQWICYPEPFDVGLEKPRYFRKDITVKNGLKKAIFYTLIDDSGWVQIDGKTVGNEGRFHDHYLKGNDVTPMLKTAGVHALASLVINMAGSGGLICRLELQYDDGTVEEICSDASWLCSTESPEGWNMPGFDAAKWLPSRAFADAISHPWASLTDMTFMLTLEESADMRRRLEEDRKKLVEIRKKLETETLPQCTVAYRKGKPVVNIGGKDYNPCYYNCSYNFADKDDNFRKQFEKFHENGFRLFGMGISLQRCWKQDGSIDYAEIDRRLEQALVMAPEGYFQFCISSSGVPRWWLNSHPDEMIQYASGPINTHEGDTIRNVLAPSYASDVWRKAFTDVISRIVKHIESTPYGKRVYAYRIDFGVYLEWHYYGMASDMPDTSVPMTRAFRSWLKQHYADETALQKAWNDNTVTFDNATVPDKVERRHKGAFTLRSPVADRKTCDYLTCMGEVVRDCLLVSNRAAKEACNNRALLGNYCGYFYHMPFPAEGWHLNNEEILDSPYVDFQVSPQCYGSIFRSIGGSQPSRSLAETYRRRGKLGLMEADGRTHLALDDGHKYINNPRESVAMLTRDFCQALALGCGYWYYDFGKAWYLDPAMEECMKPMQEIRSLDVDCNSAAEVLVIGDYENAIYSATDMPTRLLNISTSYQMKELSYSGAPFDSVSFADLASGKLRDYKIYIFLNVNHLTPEKRTVINNLKNNGHTLVWLFAPDCLTDKDISDTTAASAMAGMNIAFNPTFFSPFTKLADGRLMGTKDHGDIGPLFSVNDTNAKTLGTLASDSKFVTYASRKFDNWESVLCTTALLDRVELRKFFADRGLHRFNDNPNDVIYANKSFLGIHAKEGGQRHITLPRTARVTMLLPEKRLVGENLKDFTIDLPAVSTTLFLYE